MTSRYNNLWSYLSSVLVRKISTSSSATSAYFSCKNHGNNIAVLYNRNNVVKIIRLIKDSNTRVFSSSSTESVEGTVIPPEEVKRFVSECMVKVGTPKANADQLADVLVAADTRGHYSHGLNRLGGLWVLSLCKSSYGYHTNYCIF